MRACAPMRQPGFFGLVLLVLVPFLLFQVTAHAQEYKPRYDPNAQPQQPAGSGASGGLGSLLQGTPSAAEPPPPAVLGSLTGVELQRQGDLNEAASSLLNAMLSGKDQQGPGPSIERVVVLQDTERSLVLRVTTANAAHASIYGRVRDHQSAFQTEVTGYRYQVAPDSADIDVSFALNEDVPPDTSFDSASLALYLVRAGGSFARPDAVRTYLLPKRWESTIRADNVVVDVVFQPVGDVAQGSTPSARRFAVAPQRRLRVNTSSLGTRGEDDDGEVLWVGDEPPKTVVSTRGAFAGAANFKPQIAQLARVAVSPQLRPITADRVYRMPTRVTDRRGKGPDTTKAVDLLNQVHVNEAVPLALPDLTRIQRAVYEDANPSSQLYYYSPRSYALAWTPEGGHEMRMVFKAAGATGASSGDPPAGSVVMMARLRSGVDNRDVELMRRLLRALRGSSAELVPLPPGGPPSVSLGAELNASFDVPPERVFIQAGSESNDDIQISWLVDQSEITTFGEVLQGQGLGGNLAYEVAGETGGGVGANVRISISNPRTYGRVPWVRGQSWKNATPYPVRMRYMHALMIRNKRPVVYSWALGDAVVPSRATARFDDRLVGRWVEGPDTLRTWIDYAIDPCDTCGREVVRSLHSGATSHATLRIGFETFDPIDQIGAYRLNATVRSRYLHPTERELVMLPELRLDKDRTEFFVDRQVFTADWSADSAGTNDPLFEYLLTVITQDGDVHEGRYWIPSRKPMAFINTKRVRESLGYLPGEGGPTP